MNERIRELIEQAGPLQEVLSEITEQTNDKAPRYIRSTTLLDFQLKKFAELIIRDCYSVIIKSQRGHFNPATSWDAVKQHFGVEE